MSIPLPVFGAMWAVGMPWPNWPSRMRAATAAGGDVRCAHHLRTRGTYIHAGGQRAVVALGTANLLVIDTPDALLVADTSRAEAVKEMVAKLEALDASQAVQHRRVARPWGWYDSIDMGERF